MPNIIKVKRGTSAALNSSTEKLQAGEVLYNLDKNYLTVGVGDNDSLTKKPVAAREIVGYTGDTDSKIGTSTTEAYSIKYDAQLKIKDGNNTLLVPKKDGTLATIEDIPAKVLTETITELLPKTTVVFAEDTEHNTGLYVSGKDIITFSFVSTDDIAKGNCKYIITWDDVDYEVYEEQFSAPKYDSSGKVTTFYDWQNIGNANNDILDGYSPRTQDLPFTITQDRWENAGEVLVYAIGSTETQHTIAVKRVTGTYTRLTPEYYWNDQAYLRRGKGTSSAYVGLNSVDAFSSFASGDGNSIRGTGHASVAFGGGNTVKEASYSIISGSFNNINNVGGGSAVFGYGIEANSDLGKPLANTYLGAFHNISGPSLDMSVVGGANNTI